VQIETDLAQIETNLAQIESDLVQIEFFFGRKKKTKTHILRQFSWGVLM